MRVRHSDGRLAHWGSTPHCGRAIVQPALASPASSQSFIGRTKRSLRHWFVPEATCVTGVTARLTNLARHVTCDDAMTEMTHHAA